MGVARAGPHLTVGLRLPREIVPDYLRALDGVPLHLENFTAIRAALWRPSIQQLSVLAEATWADSLRIGRISMTNLRLPPYFVDSLPGRAGWPIALAHPRC